MKKSIAVLMLGSALLLPNNTSVEASQLDNNGLVQKAQNVQVYVLKGQVPTIQFTNYINKLDVGQIYKLVKSSDKYRWVSTPQKDKKVTEVDQAKPVEKPSTDKPVKDPAPSRLRQNQHQHRLRKQNRHQRQHRLRKQNRHQRQHRLRKQNRHQRQHQLQKNRLSQFRQHQMHPFLQSSKRFLT